MEKPLEANRCIAFAALPRDMQVLVEDFVLGDSGSGVIPAMLPRVEIEVHRIPVVELDEFDRGLAHAMAMDLDLTPPIIVAEGHFMDGRHRAHKARLDRRRSLDAIDLSGLIDARMLTCNSMGMLREPEPEPHETAGFTPR